MRIDLGMVLAIIFEYIIFIYYADTLFYRKRNKYLCYAIIALVYIADLFICARRKDSCKYFNFCCNTPCYFWRMLSH